MLAITNSNLLSFTMYATDEALIDVGRIYSYNILMLLSLYGESMEPSA